MSDEREIRVDHVGYASSFLVKLNKLRKEGKLCDFVIKVGRHEIPAHRNALVIKSEFFRAMMEHDTKENREGRVDMKDVEFTPVNKSIDFIYTGKATIATADIGGFIHVAYMMQIQELCEGIGDLLSDDLSVESFYETKKLADTYNCKGLGDTCNKFAFENFEAIVAQEEFSQLDEDYVWLLINSPETDAAEIIKYTAFTKWISCDSHNRRPSYVKLLKGLDVVNMPASYRRYIIENEPMAYESSECLRIFLSSFFETADITAENFKIGLERRIAGIESNCIVAYSPVTQAWKKIREIGASVTNASFTIVLLNRDIYVLRSDQKVFKLRYLDMKADWKEVTSLKHAHGSYPRAVVHGGSIYVIGHQTSSISASEKYDSRCNDWTDLPPSLVQVVPNHHFSVANSGRFIFCVGGWNAKSMQPIYNSAYRRTDPAPGRVYNSCEKFDTSTSTWSTTAPMKYTRRSPGAAGIEGTLYVVGGFNGKQYLSNCEIYNVANNTWTAIANTPSAFSITGSLVMGGTLYVVGGPALLKYDSEKNEWIALQNAENKSLSAAGCIPIDL